MESMIIYGSQYGTTEHYAKTLSQKTGIPVYSYQDIDDLSCYQTVIHIGGLYAGGKIFPASYGVIVSTGFISSFPIFTSFNNVLCCEFVFFILFHFVPPVLFFHTCFKKN